MPLSEDDIRHIIDVFERSGWEEIRLVTDGTTIAVSKSDAPTLAPTPAEPGAPAVRARHPQEQRWPSGDDAFEVMDEAHGSTASPPASHLMQDVTTVLAPSLGLFWRSPQPGKPPFVEVGDHVEADTTVCIIEVMKLMNRVKAGCPGVVKAIHPGNGDMVEHGQPLVTIAPE